MAHRSFSVPQVMNAIADHHHHHHHQGPVTMDAPPLSGSLAYEMQAAIPRLEKILADELSSQTLPLCIQLLKSWVATAAPNVDKHHQHQDQFTTAGRKPIRTLTRSRVSRWLLSSLSRKKPIAPAKDISESHHTDHSTLTLDLSATTTVTNSDDRLSDDSSDRSIASVCIHGDDDDDDDDSYNTSKILFHHDFDNQPISYSSSKASSLVSTPILRSAGMVQTPPHHPAAPPTTDQYQYTSIAPYILNESSTTSTPILRPTAPFRSRYSTAASTSSSPSSTQNQHIQSSSTTTTKGINPQNDHDEAKTTALAMQSSSRTASTAAITAAAAAAAATKLPRAKTTISGFLNKLGMSVKKAMGNRQHRRAHPASALDNNHDCLDSFPTPHSHSSGGSTNDSDETEEKEGYLLDKNQQQQQHDWDKEEIWRPRIESNTREPLSTKGKSPQLRSSETFSTSSDHEFKRTIPRKPVQYAAAAAAATAKAVPPTLKHSKTDMDILREQSVPFIKMGMGRGGGGLGEEEEEDQDDSVSVEAKFPSGIHELQQWHHRFHEQQQHPDKLEANLQR